MEPINLDAFPDADRARLLAAYRHVTKEPALPMEAVIGALAADRDRIGGTDRDALNRAAAFTQGTEKAQGIETWEDPLLVATPA